MSCPRLQILQESQDLLPALLELPTPLLAKPIPALKERERQKFLLPGELQDGLQSCCCRKNFPRMLAVSLVSYRETAAALGVLKIVGMGLVLFTFGNRKRESFQQEMLMGIWGLLGVPGAARSRA